MKRSRVGDWSRILLAVGFCAMALLAMFAAIGRSQAGSITLQENDGTVRTFVERQPATLPADPPAVDPEPPPATKPSTTPSEPTTPPVPPEAPSAGLPAPIDQGTMAPAAVHWVAPDPRADRVYLWTFGDGAAMAGMNVAHVYQTAGTFTVNLRVLDAAGAGVQSYQGKVTIGADARRAVNTFAELAGDTSIDLRGQTVVLGKQFPITASNVLIRNGTIRYIGPASGQILLLIKGKNVVLQDVTITSDLTTQWVKDDPCFIGGTGRNLALVDCKLLNSGHGLRSNKAERLSSVLLDRCTIDGSSSYSVWWEGDRLVVANSIFRNTWLEHLIRASDARWINLHQITTGGFVRGADLALQTVQHVSVTSCTFASSTAGIGPLHGVLEAGREKDRATNIRIDGNHFNGGRFEVAPGTEAIVTGNTFRAGVKFLSSRAKDPAHVAIINAKPSRVDLIDNRFGAGTGIVREVKNVTGTVSGNLTVNGKAVN